MDQYPMKWLRRKRPRGRSDPSRLRLWPIGWALAACFAAAATGLAGLTWLALALLHYPKLPRSSTVSLHDFVGVLQLVFASVAGAGALVALIMAYRRQRVAEIATAHDRTRVFNERFTAIATQLGDDHAAVRLAGVHAMAGLADDWQENRQTCVDVLCAYLRMPYEPEPGDDAPAVERLAFLSNREVRHTAMRIIAAHLRDDAAVSWRGLDLDFSGAVFDRGNFQGCVFSGGTVSFIDAKFSGGDVAFSGTVFSGGEVNFHSAEFSGAVFFNATVFSGGNVYFYFADFSGGLVSFGGAVFSGGEVHFDDAKFSGGVIFFDDAEFSGGTVSFDDAEFSAGTVTFGGAEFSAGTVTFGGAEFSGGTVSFRSEATSIGTVTKSGKADPDGEVILSDRSSVFSGAKVDFSGSADWSHPPTFDWEGTPPAGVVLPAAHSNESQ